MITTIRKGDYVQYRASGDGIAAGMRGRVAETYRTCPYDLNWVTRNATRMGWCPEPERFINMPWVSFLQHGSTQSIYVVPADLAEKIEPFAFRSRVAYYYFND